MDDSTSTKTRRPARRAAERSRLAGLTARHGADDPRTRVAERDFHALALEDHIAEVLAKAPPLSPAQRAKLAGLLRPAVTADAAPAEGEVAS